MKIGKYEKPINKLYKCSKYYYLKKNHRHFVLFVIKSEVLFYLLSSEKEIY